MRYTVDLPAADWPTLPEPGELVAEMTSGGHARPLTVLAAERLDFDMVRLVLDVPSRTIGRFNGSPVDQAGYRHDTAALATGSTFVCASSRVELPEINGA